MDSKLLERGIDAVRALPSERQDAAGALLLELAAMQEPRYFLAEAQIADLRRALAEAESGEFASEAEMAETWKSFGL